MVNIFQPNTAIIVMDVGDPKFLHDYYVEEIINDQFVTYLNSKLIYLKNKGFKIISSNFLGDIHKNITVQYDINVCKLEDLVVFIKNNDIKNVIYTGFHYPVCTHFGRETSSKFLKESINDINIYVCPFLCRPPTFLYGSIPPTDNMSEIKQIML